MEGASITSQFIIWTLLQICELLWIIVHPMPDGLKTQQPITCQNHNCYSNTTTAPTNNIQNSTNQSHPRTAPTQQHQPITSHNSTTINFQPMTFHNSPNQSTSRTPPTNRKPESQLLIEYYNSTNESHTRTALTKHICHYRTSQSTSKAEPANHILPIQKTIGR